MREEHLKASGRVSRRLLTPQQGVDEPVGRHDPVGVHDEERQQPPLLGPADVDEPAAHGDLDQSEDPNLHRHASGLSMGRGYVGVDLSSPVASEVREGTGVMAARNPSHRR